MFSASPKRARHLFGLCIGAAICFVGGCSEREYDASTPQAALESLREMARDGDAGEIARLIHIEARPITFADGVTEASAINEVIDKTGEMLEQLYRVAAKLREQFPQQIDAELAAAAQRTRASNDSNSDFGRWISSFLADPFGLLDEQHARLAAIDMGDGTAAITIDGKPALGGIGLQMREIDSVWKIDVPLQLLQDYRPETRHEWSALASLMLGIEHALDDFERDLDTKAFADLSQASQRAGRLLGESVIVQGFFYQSMIRKRKPEGAARE